MATGKRKITELGGLKDKMPITAFTFLIASLSIAGMPFLNGFASKTVVMHAVQASGHDVAALLLTVTSIGTWLSVVLKVNWFVFLGEARTEFEVKEIPLSMKLGMLLGAAGCIIIGIVPSILYRLLPVSYTHLDVYKRQILAMPRPHMLKNIIDARAIIARSQSV